MDALDLSRRSTAMRPPLRLRLRVFVTRAKLDRQLRDRRSTPGSLPLALRARQLVDPRTRRHVARRIRRTVDRLDRVGPRRARRGGAIDHAAVMAGRDALVELATRLEGPAPVAPRDVARAKRLVTARLRRRLLRANTAQEVADRAWDVAESVRAAPWAGTRPSRPAGSTDATPH